MAHNSSAHGNQSITNRLANYHRCRSWFLLSTWCAIGGSSSGRSRRLGDINMRRRTWSPSRRGWCFARRRWRRSRLNTRYIGGRRRCPGWRRGWSRSSPPATVSDRFFSGSIAFATALSTIRDRHLHDLPVDAAPAKLTAMPQSLVPGRITLSAVFSAFLGVHQNDASVDAAPAQVFTVALCFFPRRITLTFAFATFFRRCLDDLAVDATPTTRRRRSWSWRRAMDRRRTRKREPPTRRVFRRAGRMGT